MTHRRLRVLSLSALCLLGCAVAAPAAENTVSVEAVAQDAVDDATQAADSVVQATEDIAEAVGRTLQDIGREVGITVRPTRRQRIEAAQARGATLRERNMDLAESRVEGLQTLKRLRKWQQASLTPEQKEQLQRQARRIQEARRQQQRQQANSR
jgi:hypothetical protein